MSVDVDIVIVGAGAAGIAAAPRLTPTPLSVLLLEATGRIGRMALSRSEMRLELLGQGGGLAPCTEENSAESRASSLRRAEQEFPPAAP
jgi:choline dehydrogenase-like flavoprotein